MLERCRRHEHTGSLKPNKQTRVPAKQASASTQGVDGREEKKNSPPTDVTSQNFGPLRDALVRVVSAIDTWLSLLLARVAGERLVVVDESLEQAAQYLGYWPTIFVVASTKFSPYETIKWRTRSPHVYLSNE
jgi:hypothetical protein